MAITQALCTSFKQELLEAIHDFPNSGTGYTAGGNTLSVTGPTTSGTAAFVDFADTVWNSATFTARGALIYNSSKANRAVAVLSFGSDRAVSGGNFTVQFPTYDLSNAIVRIV